MDDFVSPAFRSYLTGEALDARWQQPPLRTEKLRLLVYVAREARRRYRGTPEHQTLGFEIGSRGAKAIRGWDPEAPRNDAGVRDLLHRISDALYPGAFNIDRYEAAVRIQVGPVPVPDPGPLARGRVTEISELGLPASFWEAARREREEGVGSDLVHVETGKPFNPKTDGRRLRERALEAARTRREADTPEPTAALIDYLHARAPRTFSDRVRRSVDDLVATARETADDDVRHAELRSIRALRLQPLPVYTTAARTQRVVPHGLGLQTAPTWVRRHVLDDCLELDMASAQLALVAALWDVPDLRAFLAASLDGGPSWWAELSGWLRRQFPGGTYDPDRHADRLKGLLKTATYGICFGMSERNVARWGNPKRMAAKEKVEREKDLRWLGRAFGARATADVGPRLLAYPLVASLLAARDRRFEEIREAGALTDVFGREYRLGERIRNREVTERSALAAEAQAAEHFVMLRAAQPFLDEATRAQTESTDERRVYPEAEIVLWQADGFSVRVRQARRERPWIEKANAGLQKGCADLRAVTGCPEVHTQVDAKFRPG